jgi:nicotinamide-nucleotide amidase
LAEEDIPLEELVGRMLISSGKKIVTAESCTGGHIAHRLTSVSGSSAYFKGSVVAYSNELKENLLGVKTVDLIQHGAVSREVVEQMTTGALQLMDADIAISTSGIAGPDGGTAEKPVGTVWIAISTKKETVSRMFQFNLNRQLNIERTTQTALLMLIDLMRNTSSIL